MGELVEHQSIIMTQTILITGASSGIGQAAALHLDGLGYAVFAGVRRKADGQALREQASPRLRPVVLDVTQAETIQAAVSLIAEETDYLSAVINNAGIAIAGPVEFVPLSELERQFQVNVIGQVAVTQAAMPFIRAGKGRIINIGSISGRVAMPFVGPYSASKFALRALTDALRQEVRPWGIHVSLIEPGAIQTPIWARTIDHNSRLLEQLPDTAHTLYQTAFERLPERTRQTARAASPVALVTQAIVRALTAAHPKPRYLVGRDARAAALFINLLPDRWRDWVIRVGLPF